MGLGGVGAIAVGGGTIEALTYADWKNAEYYLNGSPTTFEAVSEADGDWGSGVAPTVTADVGIVSTGPSVDFRFLAPEVADAPLVILDFVIVSDGQVGLVPYNTIGDWDYNDTSLILTSDGLNDGFTYDNLAGFDTDDTIVPVVGFNRLAIVFGDAALWVSLNGATAVTLPSAAPLAPYEYLYVAASNGGNGAVTTLEKIAAYPSDDIVIGDLPGLSAAS